ncbi:GNAT family N-acetyltransferase [Edaphobacter acidisoli]|nr:N-acetyltransferase [Edaphobacter acidisoli]
MISLRDYREDDLEEMTRVDDLCFAADFRFDQVSMSAFAEARNAEAVVAETAEKEMAGFVIAHLGQRDGVRRGYLVTLDVLPQYRRGGLGARLIGEMEQRMLARGAQWMDLHVFTGNDGAVRFYEQLGYERVGREERFYGDVGLDAFVYRKKLSVSQ